MTLEEWAGQVDALLAREAPAIAPHITASRPYETLYGQVPRITVDDPAWEHGGRWVIARVAEDDSSLRLAFVVRGDDPAHEKMYVRSEAGAREAASDVAAFLSEG